MSSVIDACMVFFTYAVLAMFAQNAVFSRALGVSRLVQLVGDDKVSSKLFGLMLCITQVLGVPLAWLAASLLQPLSQRAALRPAAYVACICVVCGGLRLLLQYWKGPHREKLIAIVPLAGFNSCVLGTMLVSTTQHFTLLQSFGFGVGSGLGYILAVMLVTEAQRRLRSEAIPRAFRGLPITLVYIGVLALAIYGFTGHAVII